MSAFERIFSDWKVLRKRLPGSEQARRFLLELTATPAGRRCGPRGSWLEACQRFIANPGEQEPDAAQVSELWRKVEEAWRQNGGPAGNDLRESARIMLACACAVRAAGGAEPPSKILAMLATPHYSLQAVRDTVAELRGNPDAEARDGRQIVQLPVVLVCMEQGTPATLELDFFLSDLEDYCPGFEMALAAWDAVFVESLTHARTLLKARQLWPQRCGVRWRVRFLDGTGRSLQGGSLGAALAFGTAWLAAAHDHVPLSDTAELLRAVDEPLSICLASAITPTGALTGLHASVSPKIHGARGDLRVKILVLPHSAVEAVKANFQGSHRTPSETTFLIPRAQPDASALTVVCESQLF